MKILLLAPCIVNILRVADSSDSEVCVDGICGAGSGRGTPETIRERRRPRREAGRMDDRAPIKSCVAAGGAEARVTPLSDEDIRQINRHWTDTDVTRNMHRLIRENELSFMTAVLQAQPAYAHVRSKDGRGPMWWAHEYGRVDFVRLFKSHAVSEGLRDADGLTPLDISGHGGTTLVDLLRGAPPKGDGKMMPYKDNGARPAKKRWVGLKPSDLPPPQLFCDWSNATVALHATSGDGHEAITVKVATGSILQPGRDKYYSTFTLLPSVIPRDTVASVLDLLRGPLPGSTSLPLDEDPDSVDGMPTQEIFLDNEGLRRGGFSKGQPEDLPRRKELRASIRQFLDPVLDGKITPYIRQRYSEECGNDVTGKVCTPCYSLIRRYRAGERISHAPHHDGHSFVTVVVSLSDYGREYRGGLYVASEFQQRNYLALSRGDAVVHQSDLFHGVKVLENVALDADKESGDQPTAPERWSWILWYRDSDTCEDNSHSWHEDCAIAGNPTCQLLHARTRVNEKDVLHWNQLASDNGHGAASFKLARAYLKLLPSSLAYDYQKAKNLFQRAIDLTNEPDGHYGLAGLYLEEVHAKRGGKSSYDPIMKALIHLEKAALGGHSFAMFNLGIAHLYGYGYESGTNNQEVAGEWFEACGLPEGIYLRSLQMKALGKTQEAEEYMKQARILGHGSPMREAARKHTGSGGAGGVDLNLMWPVSAFGNCPDKF